MCPRGGRLRAAVICCITALFLDGCVPTLSMRSGQTLDVSALRAFDVAGRLSARHADDAFAAGFRWQHDGDRDVMDLTSPLGQTVALLSGRPGSVEMRSANGQVTAASDWPALTERGLGWPLPVDGLAYWIQGAPRPGVTFTAERDAAGRLSVLRQDGWTIAYQAFSSDAQTTPRPARMTLSYPEVELRVVIDDWQ
jgi:outer membrane lipoprotein LolB